VTEKVTHGSTGRRWRRALLWPSDVRAGRKRSGIARSPTAQTYRASASPYKHAFHRVKFAADDPGDPAPRHQGRANPLTASRGIADKNYAVRTACYDWTWRPAPEGAPGRALCPARN